NVEWTFALEHGRPHITWKFAATLDGRSAASDGTSQWISCPESRLDVHRGRSQSDVVMAGNGTVAADNPQLTARPDGVALAYERQPTRVIVGERQLAKDAQVFDNSAPTLQIREHNPSTVVSQLADRQFRRVWIEGGAHIAGAFLQAGLVDRVIAYIAPGLLGAGLPAVITQPTTITDLRRFVIEDLSRIGEDLRVTGAF